jgi:hypothetical protein
MAHRAQVDLLVIGTDAAGYAAAACAARSGAATALVATGFETDSETAVAEPPNFVWRLLDLHQYDLRFETLPARTSYFANGAPALTTTDDPFATGRALAARAPALEHLWPAFVEEMGRTPASAAGGGASLGPGPFQTANAALDDYFADEELKTHIIGAALVPFGLAGDEAGSAAALAAGHLASRRRAAYAPLVEALKAAASAAGVDILEPRLKRLCREGSKLWKAMLDDGRDIRAANAMASSALLGEAAGLRVDVGGSPLRRCSGTQATIRIRYDRKPKLSAKDAAAAFFIAADRQAIIRARNSMIEGKLEDDAPLAFEIRGKEIIARAPYCPARLVDNGETREWTGQDRQILGRQAAMLIEKRLPGATGTPREIEVTIGPDVASGLRRRSFDVPPTPAPAPSADPIGAAAALALEISRRD